MDYNEGHRVKIIGAGVAGSILSYLLKRSGLTVDLYDITPNYVKPCGEAIPAWVLGLLGEQGITVPRIIEPIKVFSIYGGSGDLIRRVEFSEPVWYIIDKAEWINKLRRSVGLVINKKRLKCEIMGNEFIFDARGPFSSQGAKMLVWQADAENSFGLKNEAIQVIDFRKAPGLVWAFSRGDYLNIGGGIYGGVNQKLYSIKVLEKILGGRIKIINERYSLITLLPRISIPSGNCIKLGEAAGLVMSLGGEGIRPAILSAISAYKSVRVTSKGLSFSYESYIRGVHDLIYQVRLHNLIFRIALVTGQGIVEKILGSVEDELMREWLSGQLGLSSSLPKILHGVLKSLLS